MGASDPFRITDKLEDPLLDVMVSRLEVRGKHWFFRKVLREYLDAMAVDSAGTVLDMGCGTGVAARTIARRANFSGRVMGIDLSPYLVKAASHDSRRPGIRDDVRPNGGAKSVARRQKTPRRTSRPDEKGLRSGLRRNRRRVIHGGLTPLDPS